MKWFIRLTAIGAALYGLHLAGFWVGSRFGEFERAAAMKMLASTADRKIKVDKKGKVVLEKDASREEIRAAFQFMMWDLNSCKFQLESVRDVIAER